MNKIYFILIALILASYGVFSQENQPDAIFNHIRKEYKLNNDGSITYHYSHKLKILSYFAFHRQYGETSVIYDPRFQKVKVNYAYTTTPDGKNIASPPNAFNEVLPDFAANAPAYNYLRRLVIVHTALEKEAVINVDYEVTTQNGYYPALTGNETIPGYSPIEQEDIIVKIPKAMQLSYKLLNSPVLPDISTHGDTALYHWTFKKMAAIIPEIQVPPAFLYAPYLIFSSATDFKSVYRKIIDQDAFKNIIDDKMKAWVTELKKNSLNEMDFLLKLQHEIAINIKTYNVPLNLCGFQVKDPITVFNTNGGTPLEKAGLMCALLANVMIRAYPVVAAHESLFDSEIGNFNIFNEVYVRVNTDPLKTIYFPVDKTVKQNQKFSLNNKKLIPLMAELKILEITTENGPENYLSLNGGFKMIDDNLIKGRSMVIMKGCVNPYFSILGDSLKAVKENISGITPVKDKWPNIIENTTFQSSYEQEYTVNSSSMTWQDNLLFIDLPYFNDGFESWHITGLNAKRNHPYMLPFPLHENYNLTIDLPKNYKLASSVNMNLTTGAGKISIRITQEKRRVYIYREITLNKTIIETENHQYESLAALMNLWLEKNKRLLVLEKKMK